MSIDISSNNQFSQGKRYKRIQTEIKVPSQVENSYCLDSGVRGLLTNHKAHKNCHKMDKRALNYKRKRGNTSKGT